MWTRADINVKWYADWARKQVEKRDKINITDDE